MAAKSGVKQVIQNVARLFAEPATQTPLIPARIKYKSPASNVDALPTGFRPLDKALGVGGLPYGKIIELIGPGDTLISGGAVSVSARIAAKVQRQQEIITIIDMTHSFDPWQAERCGLIAPHLLLTRPATVFEALTNLENATRNAQLVVVIMGVVTELMHQVEANSLKTLLRRLQTIVQRSSSVCLFVTTAPKNNPFDPQNYPAGFPLADIAHIRLWLQEENWTRKNGVTTTYKASLTVIKNDLAMAGTGANIKIKMTGP